MACYLYLIFSFVSVFVTTACVTGLQYNRYHFLLKSLFPFFHLLMPNSAHSPAYALIRVCIYPATHHPYVILQESLILTLLTVCRLLIGGENNSFHKNVKRKME